MKYFTCFSIICCTLIFSICAFAENNQLLKPSVTIKSPDSLLSVSFYENGRSLSYTVSYREEVMLENSPLGLETNLGDFNTALKIVGTTTNRIEKKYLQDRIKKSSIEYTANELIITLANKDDRKIDVVFRVNNNNIGFKYSFPQFPDATACIIKKELSGFNFPQNTTTFLSPQATPLTGWQLTKPSYEEEYTPDEAVGTVSKYGLGYTFPGLFHVGENGWVLVSETGVSGSYCGSRLSESSKDGIYRIAYPEPKENNQFGSVSPTIALPGSTPWRTITVGDNLKPIVETTIPYDLVDPLYEASQKYQYGRATWSWIMWQDASMNYQDQVAYIDLAAKMGYEYILIDALWDQNIGYDKMKELVAYAKSKRVDVFLWYNSNGLWNTAPQTPVNKMSNVIVRKKEMKWLQEAGVKGLKIDFWGGDKQATMELYEQVLSDANDYGLMVIFHGCTLPRGWERMYPNFVGSEAVLASENLNFKQHFNDYEAFNACLHPFIRNAVGAMDFGPVLLNKHRNRENNGGTTRRVSDVVELATGIMFQNPIQNFGIAPNNMEDMPDFEIDFMKEIPTTWDEIKFIDGYPGKYCVLARRHANNWYVVGINAEKEAITLDLNLPMFAGETVTYYGDNKQLVSFKKDLKVKASGAIKLILQSNGGVILIN